MFLTLGQSAAIPAGAIIGIFDFEKTTRSRKARNFLKRAEDEGRVVSVTGGGPPRAYVVTEEDGATRVYLTRLAAATLAKRKELIDR